MGLNQWFCINSSGRTYPIYDSDRNDAKVGDLYPREAFIIYGSEGCFTSICFLGPNGGLQTVIINTDEHPLPSYWFNTDKSYGTANITTGNRAGTYKTFRMRSNKVIYRSDGTRWGTVSAGCLVATNNENVGSDHPDWKEITYVQNTSGQWVQVDENGSKYGFVDTGLSSASGSNSIAFYGSRQISLKML